jgi:hypothetical protein
VSLIKIQREATNRIFKDTGLYTIVPDQDPDPSKACEYLESTAFEKD